MEKEGGKEQEIEMWSAWQTVAVAEGENRREEKYELPTLYLLFSIRQIFFFQMALSGLA